MLKARILYFAILMVISAAAMAQTSNNPKEDNSFEPFSAEKSAVQKKTMKKKGKKSARGIFNRKMDLKIKEFDKRMQANAKAERKKQREMRKPQYSDPSYFGHKKKPKKRPPGKRKFCKECGIWH
ncbi:MAG TPA: hypothetical protein PKL31_03590 [Fulvivirga sp.]|nr:hypothetical protein [Fulvivirga sp.]